MNLRFTRRAWPWAAVAIAATPLQAGPQALCSLRDPKSQILQLFPDADGYRSIVGTVGKQAREHVGRALPFTLHFNELGRHTLYVPYRDGQPMGFVHSRSEAGRWGLVEVVWGFDLEMRITGFEFQRCRDRAKRAIDNAEPERALVGLDFAQLRMLLNPTGEALRKGAWPLPKSAHALGETVVRNGLKTIAVTENVWGNEIWSIRALSLARSHAPTADVATPVDNVAARTFEPSELVELGLDPSGVFAWRVTNGAGDDLGTVLRTPWNAGKEHADLMWWISEEERIGAVTSRFGWPSPRTKGAFERVVGMTLKQEEDCASATELVGFAALTVARRVRSERSQPPR